jgi:hypothetical protein
MKKRSMHRASDLSGMSKTPNARINGRTTEKRRFIRIDGREY